ncbi:DUF1919 domain-containing protein [Sporosarcina sp. CAU 1771]
MRILKKVKKPLKMIVENFWFESPYIEKKVSSHREHMQSKYNYENNPTIISSNCIGGIIYNNLNHQFLSPTVNLFISSKDFIKFINNLKVYLNTELTFKETSSGGYPIGLLNDITIHFNHYENFDEAKAKWEDRAKRVDYNNLYIMLHDRNLDYEDIKGIGSVKCKRLIVFSAKKYPEFEYVYQFKRYERIGKVGQFVIKDLDGFREFEKTFDYVEWLNGGNKLERKSPF